MQCVRRRAKEKDATASELILASFPITSSDRQVSVMGSSRAGKGGAGSTYTVVRKELMAPVGKCSRYLEGCLVNCNKSGGTG